MRKVFPLYLIALILSNYSFANQDDGQKIFTSFKNSVFRIRTHLPRSKDKVSYGSGFPVLKSGYIVTNYHVVSKALMDNSDYQVTVTIDQKDYLAKIVNFNVTYDLAILKINTHFENIFKAIHETPKEGIELFSLGYPEDLDLSLTRGTFNGIEKNGRYLHYHISSPINKGMSGGPTVNAEGLLIGINVSILLGAQNISFLVPSSFIDELLFPFRENDQKPLNYLLFKNKVNEKISNQIYSIQKALIDEFNDNEITKTRIGDFEINKGPPNLKCWEKDLSDKDHNLYKIILVSCSLGAASYINRGTYSGTYAFNYIYLEGNNISYPAFYNMVKDNFKGKTRLKDSFVSLSHYKNKTNFDCKSKVITNERAIPFKVSYCLNGYNYIPKIRDLELKATTILKKKKALVLKLKLTGFKSESVTDFISILLNGINFHES